MSPLVVCGSSPCTAVLIMVWLVSSSFIHVIYSPPLAHRIQPWKFAWGMPSITLLLCCLVPPQCCQSRGRTGMLKALSSSTHYYCYCYYYYYHYIHHRKTSGNFCIDLPIMEKVKKHLELSSFYTSVYQKSWSYAIVFLRYGVWRM